jgi:hypothetical protein
LRRSVFAALLTIPCVLLLGSCGGGGNSTGPPPPSPDFSLSVSPMSASMAPGTSVSIQVKVGAVSGFSGQVSIALTGLPANVTSTPASPFVLTSGQQQVVILKSSSAASDGSVTITLTGSSGNLTHSFPLVLNIVPPAPIILSPASSSLSLYPGTSATTTFVAIPGTGSTNYTLAFSASELPAGVTASFAPNDSAPNTPVTLTLSASPNVPTVQTVSIEVTATRSTDSAQFEAQIAVVIAPQPGTLAGNRTATVRTDSTPVAGVFDPAHQIFYAALPGLNRVDAISSTSEQILRQIPIPNPTSVAITPDGKRILVGTQGQNVFWIDTSSLLVVRQDTIPMVTPNNGAGPQYVTAQIALPTANGSVIILASLNSLFSVIVEWNPSTGSARIRYEEDVSFDPAARTLVAPSANGSEIFFGGSSTAALYVAATDSFISTNAVPGVLAPAANSSGDEFASVSGTTVYFFDSNLGLVGQTAINSVGVQTGAVYSADGKFLYVVTGGNLPLIFTIDAKSFKVVGTAPAYVSFYAAVTGPPNVDVPLSADATGLIFGSIDHAVVFDDSTNFQNFPIVFNFGTPQGVIIDTPDEGLVSATTTTQITTQVFPLLPDVWFGPQRAVAASFSNGAGQIQATAPAAQSAGSVDVKVVQPNGLLSIIPQGFTYGTEAVSYTTLASPPSGGGIADLFGFGFSVDVPNSKLEVSVGTSNATIDKDGQVQGLGEFSLPYPLQHIQFTIPAGTPGREDIHITTPVGQVALLGGFRYISSVMNYPSTDKFAAVVYDKSRNQLYLSASNQVDVFSLASNSFGTPIQVPTLVGKVQLAGLALTPDSSQLLVANLTDNSVAILNPDSSSGGIAVSIVPQPNSSSSGPDRVVTTSLGTAFVDASVIGQGLSGAASGIYELNLSTHKVTVRGEVGPINLGGNFLEASGDGTEAFLAVPNNSGGFLFSWSATTDLWHNNNLQQFLADGAVSADGNVFSTLPIDPDSGGLPPYVLDSANNTRCQVDVLDVATPGYVTGETLDASGALVYVPTGLGLDIFDAHHCDLRERILFPQQINSLATTPSAIDALGQRIFTITSNGLTIVTLDQAPLSIGHLVPTVGSPGATIKIRGTGFVSGTIATFNSVSSAVTVADASTLETTVPSSLSSGSVSLTLTNPDGSTYQLDDAFTIN